MLGPSAEFTGLHSPFYTPPSLTYLPSHCKAPRKHIPKADETERGRRAAALRSARNPPARQVSHGRPHHMSIPRFDAGKAVWRLIDPKTRPLAVWRTTNMSWAPPRGHTVVKFLGYSYPCTTQPCRQRQGTGRGRDGASCVGGLQKKACNSMLHGIGWFRGWFTALGRLPSTFS
jgi:hypothetical protein